MENNKMTPLQRVFKTLSHQEPDQVPLFLNLTMHGAKELDMSIKKYFSSAKYVADGQIRMQKKFKNDCVNNFFYAPVEIEAWGGEVIYVDNGPPNSGEPFIKSFNDIKSLKLPDVKTTPCLQKVFEATHIIKEHVKDEIPIIGVAISPFSLPVMQMGFENYIQLMYEHPDLFNQLININKEFCINYANAQLNAGATAICYFDPVSSSTIITREIYLKTGFKIASETISKINGPTATHMASGRCISILDDICKTGTGGIGVSTLESLSEIKAICKGRISVLGNLNGIEMRRWDAAYAEKMVKSAIFDAAEGGGFIVSDNHGEIPWDVSDEVLFAVSDAVQKWGKYPIIKNLQ